MYKVLIVEDEYHIRNIIKEYFCIRNIEVIEASQGYQALELINNDIDLVLLDIMMSDINGYDVCKQIRQLYQVPIIFISALSQERDQLAAYQLGADDYITKPFKPSILYAKVMALMKRDKKIDQDIIEIGHIQLDNINHFLIVDNNTIALENREYELLHYLCIHQNQTLTRKQILDKIWGYDYFGDGRAIDTYIKKIRKKLGKYACYIQTIIKTGYVLKVVNTNEENCKNDIV